MSTLQYTTPSQVATAASCRDNVISRNPSSSALLTLARSTVTQTQSSNRLHAEDHITAWELFGQQAIGKCDRKVVYITAPNGPELWQLYDLRKDPGETEDLAESQVKILDDLIEHWTNYVAEKGTILLDRSPADYGPRQIIIQSTCRKNKDSWLYNKAHHMPSSRDVFLCMMKDPKPSIVAQILFEANNCCRYIENE